MTQPNELEAAKSPRHNQISSLDQGTRDLGWQAILEVMTCPKFWSMRWLSCSCFWSSSNRLAVLSNTSSAAAVFFFSSSSWSWRTTELCFWALSSQHSAASWAREDFEEGVDRPAFFKNVLLKLHCDKILETTSALLVLCNIMNKMRKRTDTAVAFTQDYSRVSYPLGNVSTLSTGSGSSKDTHWCRRDRTMTS